jgi:hypothetical protein
MGLVLKESQDPLLLSKDFKSVEEIKSIAPELVQKRYDLNVAEVAASDIEMRATLKDVWNWQLDSANWPKLLVKFPELGKEYNLTREQRLARLEALLPANRLAVDQFTRKEILNEHSQWIIDALDSASFNKVSITIKEKGCSIKQLGLSKAKVLQTLLDNYPLNGSIEEEAQKFAKDSLYNYTEDGSKYFRIEVIGRENAYSPLTFKEALDDGSLKIISDKNKQDITLITDLVLQYADEKGYPWHESGGLTKQEFAAQYRFLKYANEVLNQVKASDFTSVQNQQDSDLKAAFLDSKNLSPFFDQFKMVKKDTSIARSDYVSYDMDIFYTVSKDQLSNVVMLPKSNAYFFKVNDFKKDVQGAILLMQKAQKEIGRQAAMLFLKSELDQMMTKKALSIYKMPQEGLDS